MKISDQDTKFAASTVDEQIDALTELQGEELRSSSFNVRMLQDLYQVYDHASYSRQLERSLERLGQRLEAQKMQHIEADRQEKQDIPPVKEITAPAQTGSRSREKRKPARHSRALSRLASVAAVFFVALLVGSLILTLQATRHHGSETVGKAEPQIISVHMGPDSFLTSSVILRPGMSVQLVNDTSVVHIIDNGYWDDNGQKNLLHEPGMPTSSLYFEAIHGTRLIGPFKTLGIYHLFDEIHVNMNLTIYVQLSGTPGVVTPTPVKNAIQVHLEPQTFLPHTIIIRKGMSLLLVNDNQGVEHLVMNGYWQGDHIVYIAVRGKPLPRQMQLNLQDDSTAQLKYIDGQGVPIVDIVFQPGNSDVEIGPFLTAGTYSFLDTVHVGMNLTVVVQ